MAGLLYRIGEFSFRRGAWVLAAWTAIAAALAALALSLGGSLTQSFEIPGTESDQAQALATERFGAGASALGGESRTDAAAARASARVVVAAPAERNLLTGGLQTVLTAFAPLAQAPGIAAVSDPIAAQAVAPDGSVTYLDVQFTTSADDVAPATADQVRAAAEGLRGQGFDVAVTGGPFTEPLTLLSGTEAIGVAFALLVLLVMFGSALAAGIPILTALVGVGIGAAGILAVAATVDMSSATLALALMLGLAVGIDYALFLLSRHRQQLAGGMAPAASAALANATAGNAVVLAGVTTIIALVALAVVGIPFLTLMGLAAAATVAVAVLIAVTLVPAMMGFAGNRLSPRGRATRDLRSMGAENRWGSLVTRRPLVTLAGTTILLAVVALPVLDLELGLPDAGEERADSPARQAYDMLAGGFGPGFNGPLVVLVDGAGGDLTAAVDDVSREVAALDVAYVAPAVRNAQGDAALVVVIPQTAPNTRATTDLVHAIRDLRPGIEAQTGAELWVTGAAAANVDISERLADALPQFLLIVVGLAFVLLMIAFRSLLVPLTAVGGFLLAVAAALGATVAVYQWGWLGAVFGVVQPAPLVNFMPIVMVGVMFGLAMDYQVFLVSRMREEFVHGNPPAAAVRVGFAHGARVVFAAALIMISVFTSFVFGGESVIAPVAFALAAGIVMDALVVRMCAIPAVMALLGRHAWWLPRWLDRVLPNIDLEGSRIGRVRAEVAVPVEPLGVAR